MIPTMSAEGEVVLENRLITPSKLKRGDLVTFISPLDPTRMVCKRLIGLPGDIVCVDPTGTVAPSTEHVVIPKGHLWLTGDNADMSRDSREYGPVSMSLVKGKLIARVCMHFARENVPHADDSQIWPLSEAGRFRNNFQYLDQ